MKKTFSTLVLLLFLLLQYTTAQQTAIKNYPAGTKAGEVELLYDYGEYMTSYSNRVYVINVKKANKYYLSALTNMLFQNKNKVYLDGISAGAFDVTMNGWQLLGSNIAPLDLTVGKHEIKISAGGPLVPMVEEIKLTTLPVGAKTFSKETAQFLEKMRGLEALPKLPATTNTQEDITSKVLPNPYGDYNHAIDTSFSYSNFSWIYLNVGYHTFTTSGSTIDRALTIFNPNNFTYSWSNVNGGVGGESSLPLYVNLAGYYAIMLRPVTDGATGVTNIIYNGSTLVANATIGGRRIAMSTLKGGTLNFFTCKLTGGDTRMIASRYAFSSARGYNDDYSGGGGDWNWGLASRIKKSFNGADSVQYGYVCAYSPSTTGLCDIYLGNINSDVNNINLPEFPLLKPDDAILSSPASAAWYNCIAWSGGLTTTFIWPPSAYSTYNCTSTGMDVACFDNFYSNNPIRYPGAWNYTRTGANVGNSMVDLWALNGYFTHASVRKPGNNQPHGYDWESKPGSLSRTFHPRNALTNLSFGYGSVVNYYIPTGTYARTGTPVTSFETDIDAVKAGVAVFENARLTIDAQEKLRRLVNKIEPSFTRQFNELYNAWEITKVANSLYSDPAQYCKNESFTALEKFCSKNKNHALVLIFEKFINANDHIIGELMWTLTKDNYRHLLDEVKTERNKNPNDVQGRYKIHGDHDNGVLYVEKILKNFEIETSTLLAADIVSISVLPNPVKDKFTVQVKLTENSQVSVQAVSAQSRITKQLQAKTTLSAGLYQFTANVNSFAALPGDIITVTVQVNGVSHVVRALVQ